jgi:hypothetical protein
VEALSSRRAPAGPSIADIPSETWLLFLALERCAAVLLDRLTETGGIDALPAESADMIRTVAAEEAQSALRAQVDGRAIGSIARNADFPVVVLKGGVRTITGMAPALPVADIDLLVSREHASQLVEMVRAAGLGEPARALPHHQGLLPPVDGLAVEVHWTTHDDGKPLDPTVWSRLQPLEGATPLMRLGPRDHVIHLLEHAILIHRERSVSLRDTVLIGLSASECTVVDLEDVRRAVANNAAMSQLLAFAIAVHERQSPDDPFIESCASFYAALALIGEMKMLQRSTGAMAFVTELELARIPRSLSIRNTLRWRGTGVTSLANAADRLRGVGPLVLAPVRLGYYSLVAVAAIPMIRRTKRKALTSLARQNVRVSS